MTEFTNDHTKVTRCDMTNCVNICETVYLYENKEICKECAEQIADEWFEELTLGDKFDLFNWDIDEYESREGAEVEVSKQWYNRTSFDEKLDIMSDYDDTSFPHEKPNEDQISQLENKELQEQ